MKIFDNFFSPTKYFLPKLFFSPPKFFLPYLFCTKINFHEKQICGKKKILPKQKFPGWVAGLVERLTQSAQQS